MKTAIMISLGLTIGNFIWQIFAGQHWGVAVERSFFQIAAIIIYTWRSK